MSVALYNNKIKFDWESREGRTSFWLYLKYFAPDELFQIIKRYFLDLLISNKSNMRYFYPIGPNWLAPTLSKIKYLYLDTLRRFNTYCRMCGVYLKSLLPDDRLAIICDPWARNYLWENLTVNCGGVIQNFPHRPALVHFPLAIRICSTCVALGKIEPYLKDVQIDNIINVQDLNSVQATAKIYLEVNYQSACLQISHALINIPI